MDNQQPSNNIFYLRPKKGYGFIYKYTSPNGKSYIGQTINNLATRAKNPVSGIGYKKCSLFWKAIQKYQFINFKIEILEEVEIKQLNQREKFYISQYNTLAPNGYNLTIGGDIGKTVDVYVYSSQNGEFLEHYNSISDASLMTGVPIETISTILSNKNNRKIAHNLTFSKIFCEKIDILNLSRNNYRNVYVYNLEGKLLYEFKTIVEASKKLRISESTIRRHLNDKKQSCGYYFRETKDKITPITKIDKLGKKVCQIDPNTYMVIKVYNSLAAAAREVGLSSSSAITRAINRNGKAKGYYWRIIEGSTTKYSEKPTESVRDTHTGEDIV